jgi:hypothetical protein
MLQYLLVGRILPIFIYSKEEISIVLFIKFFLKRKGKVKAKERKEAKEEGKAKKKTKPYNANLLSSI